MVGLIVTGHGKFASGFEASLKLLAGSTEGVTFVDFDGESGDALKEKLAETMDSMKECSGVLVLADLPGGTPYNKSVELKLERADQVIEVMAGTNLPLLLATATMLDTFETPAELAQTAILDARDSLVIFGLEVEDSAEEAGSEDFDDLL